MVEHFDAFLKIEDAGFVMAKTTLLWTGPYFLMLHTLKHFLLFPIFPALFHWTVGIPKVMGGFVGRKWWRSWSMVRVPVMDGSDPSLVHVLFFGFVSLLSVSHGFLVDNRVCRNHYCIFAGIFGCLMGHKKEQGYNEDLKYGCCFWHRKTTRKLKYEISSSHDHLSPLRPELNHPRRIRTFWEHPSTKKPKKREKPKGTCQQLLRLILESIKIKYSLNVVILHHFDIIPWAKHAKDEKTLDVHIVKVHEKSCSLTFVTKRRQRYRYPLSQEP